MGFSSQDDFVSEITANGKFWRSDWNKITGAGAYTAGRWYDMSLLSGTPIANIYGDIVINGNFLGSIANWTANGTNWVYGTNSANKTSGTSTTLSSDSVYIAVVAGRYYRTQYTIAGYTSGTCTISVGGTAGTARSANGTYVEVLTATNTNGIVFTASVSTAVFNISAVSVVEWGAASGTITPSAQIISETTSQGSLYHGGDVSTDTKHIINVGAVSAVATFVPGVWYLVDLLLCYPYIDANSNSAQTCTNNNSLSRYTDGKGVRMFIVANTTLGANAHNFSVTYTRATTGGTDTGRVLPVTVAGTVSAIAGHISHSGVAANNYGPFLPMASGDMGVKSVQTVQLSAAGGTASTYFTLVLCKPLVALPMTTASVMAERDLMNQLPSLPRVYDGAKLAWLFFAGGNVAATSNAYGYIETAWG